MEDSDSTRRGSGPRESRPDSAGGLSTRRGKKPYEKPRVAAQRVFETLALQCGKVSTTQRNCQFNRNTS